MEVTPYTQNDHYLQERRVKWLARYKAGVRDEVDPGGRQAKRQRVDEPPNPSALVAPNGGVPRNELEDMISEGDSDGGMGEAPKEPHTPLIDQRTRAAVSALADAGYLVTPDNLAKLIPARPYEAEIAVVAEARGKVCQSDSNELQPFLIASFELGTQSASRRCAKYLEEDKVIVSRRTELQATKARLEEVEKELFKFGLQFLLFIIK